MVGATRRRILGLGLGGAMAVSAPRWGLATGATPLRCAGIDLPPWIVDHGAGRGITADLLAALADAAGMPINLVPVPHARMIRDFANGQLDLVLFPPQPELEAAGHVLGSVGQLQVVVLLRHGVALAGLGDLAGRPIGLIRGGAHLAMFDTLPGMERVEVTDVSRGIDMVLAGRLDGYIGIRLAIDWQLRQQGLMPQSFGGFLPIRDQPYRLYANMRNPLPPADAQRLSRACEQVAARFDRLVAPYVGFSGTGDQQQNPAG